MDTFLIVLLYLNSLLATANAVIYWVAANKAPKQYRLLKRWLSVIMITTVLIYAQLVIPGEFMALPGGDAMLVRLNFTALLILLCLYGLIGMIGDRGTQ